MQLISDLGPDRDLPVPTRRAERRGAVRAPDGAAAGLADVAAEAGLRSVAFCCISTGEFHFPNRLAAEIAIKTVGEWQKENPSQMEVIFNVFKDNDYRIYQQLLR